MNDKELVKRLNDVAEDLYVLHGYRSESMRDAAARLTALAEENERLKAVCQAVINDVARLRAERAVIREQRDTEILDSVIEQKRADYDFVTNVISNMMPLERMAQVALSEVPR